MNPSKEYQRRRLVHVEAIKLEQALNAVIERLRSQKHPPLWLLGTLIAAHIRTETVLREVISHCHEAAPK